MKHSLNKKGLSMSQAQSISNMCFQRAQEIANQLSVLNNAEKTVGIGGKTYVETKGNPIPADLVKLILEKASLHATQAFLMENIKAKDMLLRSIKNKLIEIPYDMPKLPEMHYAEELPFVDESWGWDQLSIAEQNEFLMDESFAAHIGQFIHKGCPLDNLRRELPVLKTLEWITIEDGKKTPLEVKIHHTPEELLKFHEELASKHREHEQRVNYFKAKVKNLVSDENARIANINSTNQADCNAKNQTLLTEYNKAVEEYNGLKVKFIHDFEKIRMEEMKEAATLRIEVDPKFQPMIDFFIKQVKE